MPCSGLLDMPCVIGYPNSRPLIRAPPFCYTLCLVYVPNISGKSLSFDTRPILNSYGVKARHDILYMSAEERRLARGT